MVVAFANASSIEVSLSGYERLALNFMSIGDTTEFQLAFHGKISRNYIFEATNYRRITLIFSLLEEQLKTC